MKKLLLLLALLALPSTAHAQCNGVFPNQTVCGNVTGSGNLPRPTSPAAFLGAAGGTNGQIQYNNSGTLGGFTAGQDCTINTSTGAVNCTKLQNIGVTTTGAATNDVLYYNGTNWLHNAFINILNAVCTISPSTCAGVFGYVLPAWYGALCDGSTDDTTAMQAAITGAAGRKLFIPAGTCVITAHLNMVSNIHIAGVDRDRSIIKQTAADYTFRFTDVDNTIIEDLYLLGNRAYTTWTASTFGPLVMLNSATHSNWTFRRLKATNWNASYWNYFSQVGGIGSNLTLDDILITTTTSDIPTDPTVTNNTNYAFAVFSGAGGIRWENVTANNIQVDGVGLCFGFVNFSNTYKYRYTNGRYLNMGGVNTAGHCTNGLGATNAYGIAVYDLNSDSNPPSDGNVSGNYIVSPIAAGIYVVGDGIQFTRAANTNKLLIENNVIINQTHTDVLLPRGAIVANLSTDIAITGNALYNNATGINIAGQSAGDVSVLANHCSSTAGSSICMQLTSGGNGSANTDRRIVRNNFFSGLGTSVIGASVTASRFNTVDIADNTIVANGTGLSFVNQFVSGVVNISNNIFEGAGTGASVGGLTGSMTINNNANLSFTSAALPAGVLNGSFVFVSDGTPATACVAAGTGSTGFRQNGAWKCF